MSPRRPAVDTLLARLAPTFGDRLRTDPEALAKASGDESGVPAGDPAAVLFVNNRADVVAAAREAASLGVALVPRGAGTGKAGACIPRRGEVVVDFGRMRQVLEIRPQDSYAVVEPGVITGDFHAAVAAAGCFYPPDPGSLESCTLGGNISTNAGGPRAAKYGVTQRYVWGLEVVLMGGEVLQIGRKSLKGVAGLDLTALMVGSEGCLGFITQATLHVIRAPAAVETAWLTFDNLLAASRAAEALFAAGLVPRMLEVIDRVSQDNVRKVATFRIPEGAGTSLLLEMDGEATRAMPDLERACEIALAHGAVSSALAKNEKEREAMRRTRRLVASALKETWPAKLSDDIAVPRSRMVEMLERASELGDRAQMPVCAYGHLGDGNLHVNILCASLGAREAARSLRRQILATAVHLGGTISGEHGIGLSKRELLGIEQSAAVVGLQRRLKSVFDPHGLLNPGKVWPET